MIVLKKIDVYGQIFTAVLLPLIALINPNECTIFAGYFIVGGWQVISTLVHKFFCKGKLLNGHRSHYEKVLLGIILYASLILYQGLFDYFLAYGLLLFSPIMAVWYIRFNYKELQIWEARAFIHLK